MQVFVNAARDLLFSPASFGLVSPRQTKKNLDGRQSFPRFDCTRHIRFVFLADVFTEGLRIDSAGWPAPIDWF